jgi:zinc transport system permease protein
MELAQFLSYSFVHRALAAGCLIALVFAVLGVFLVVRRFSLIGEGLAHVSFFAAALGLVLKTNPLYVSIPVVGVSSLGVFNLSKKTRISSDSAIGIISALGISLAVIITSLSAGFTSDIFGFLFGSILTVTAIDLAAAAVLFFIVAVFIFMFYNDLVCIAFNAECAALSNIKVSLVDNIFVVIVGISVVTALKIMGIMLVSALFILPAVTALQFGRGFKPTLVIACVCSVLSVAWGIVLSFVLNLPASQL